DRDERIIRLVQTIDEHCGFVQRTRPVEEIVSQKEILQKLMVQIIECAEFIRIYARDKQFVIKALKNHLSNVDRRIKEYEDAFAQFRAAFTEESQLQSQITIMNIQKDIVRLKIDIDWNDMPYANGARYQSGKGCFPGTRTDILLQIFNWVYDTEHQQRIFLLTGPAGSGKSAIAHTVAKTFYQQGRLGSSFCFRRNDATRTLQLFFPTLARDLADCDPGFKASLGQHINSNRSLRKTEDLLDQFEQFISTHSSNSCFIGQMLIVIDALDEASDSLLQRSIFFQLLADSDKIQRLPSNIRIFITSRPQDDIKHIFTGLSHIHTLPLFDAASCEAVKDDIFAFVCHELIGNPVIALPGIQQDHCSQIAEKSQGLFQWAAVICRLLKEAAAKSKPPVNKLRSLLQVPSNDLNNIYKVALEQNFDVQDDEVKEMFQVVVGFILAVQKPLSSSVLKDLWKVYGEVAENAATFILPRLGALFHGVEDDTPIIPIHTSVRDYLTDLKSGDFYIQQEASHAALTIATLKILNHGLHFNMCKLSNSLIPNSNSPDLNSPLGSAIPLHLAYASQFVGRHFQSVDQNYTVALIFRSEQIATLIRVFLQEKLLFWLEVLGILKTAESASSFLSDIIAKFQVCSFKFKYTLTYNHPQIIDPQSVTIAREAIRFVRMAGPVIEYATPHIYLSAIPFIPSGSILSSLFMKHSQQVAKVAEGLEERWPNLEHTITSRERHTSSVMSVAFSPDGQRVVSGSADATIRIWDAQTGNTIAGPFHGCAYPVRSVAFSPDGQRVVSGSVGRTIRIWDAHAGNQITGSFCHPGWVTSVAFSPDGQRVVSGSHDKTIRIWDVQTGNSIGAPLQGHTHWVLSVAFSPDGHRIVSGSFDQTIRLWDAHTGNQIAGPFQGHTSFVNSVAFSPDGQRVVSGSDDQTIRVWDAQIENHIATPFQGHTKGVTSVAFSSDGKRVVSGSYDGTIQSWDVQTGSLTAIPCSSDKTIRIWDAHTGNLIAGPFQGHRLSFRSVAFSPDGKKIVSGSDNQTIQIWDAHNGKLIAGPFQGHTHWINSVAFSPDGQKVVSGSRDKTIRIWDAQTGNLISGPFQGHSSSVNSVAFSPDGQRILSGSDDKTILIWDAQTGNPIGAPFQGHTGFVSSVAFSPDGHRIASGSYDQTLRIWNAHTGKLVAGPFQGHTQHVTSVAFSRNGQMVVSGSSDQTLRIWDAQTENLSAASFQGHASLVTWMESVHAGCSVQDAKALQIAKSLMRAVMVSFSPHRHHSLYLKSLLPYFAKLQTGLITYDRDSGWIIGPEKMLILWIPSAYRDRIWPLGCVQMLGINPVILDLSQLACGPLWVDCWKD
ncbi:hypothetical protein M422DRAFT_171544, partial [Sphaerobolus stellatus SS14]